MTKTQKNRLDAMVKRHNKIRSQIVYEETYSYNKKGILIMQTSSFIPKGYYDKTK